MRWLRLPVGGIPIAVALTAAMGLAILLVLATVLGAGYLIARSNTAELVRSKAELITRSLEDRVRGQLEPVQAQLAFLAGRIGREGLGLEDRQRLETLLTGSLAAVPQVSAVAWVAPDLRVLRAFRHRTGPAADLRDWSEDAAFARLIDGLDPNAGAQWGPLFVAENVGSTLLNLLQPVAGADGMAGVLVAGISVRELSEFIAALARDERQTPFILLGRDRVLAHPLLRAPFAGLTDAAPLPGLGTLGDPVLAAIWSEPRRRDVERDFANAVEARVVDLDGDAYVFLFRDLAGFGPDDWLVGTYFALADVAPQLGRLGRLVWFGGAVGVLALVLAFFLGRSLSAPIRRLAHAAGEIGRLDFERVRPPPPGPFRELNEVAGAQEEMLCALRLFGAYVPRPLVRRLMRRDGCRRVPSEDREVTIMFTDLVGFTTLSEDLPAGAVADLLNAHFTLVGACIEAEEGTLDKFIGDSVMAFWGAPLDQPDQADRACRAALAIGRAMHGANLERARHGVSPLRVRIGIHTGKVIVGDIGGPSRINYTIIGDAVNVGERLEELARSVAGLDQECATLLSAATVERLHEPFPLAYEGVHVLRGRHDPLAVHRLAAAATDGTTADAAERALVGCGRAPGAGARAIR